MTATSAQKSRVIKQEPLTNEEAVWTKFVKTVYKDPNGTTRTWESAERKTRPRAAGIDGVGIVAVIENPQSSSSSEPLQNGNGNGVRVINGVQQQQKQTDGPLVVLQKQYRPPLDRICIEVPAGLVDEGETTEEAALRELKEETGYIGVVAETSPIMFNDPGFCNTNLQMVHVTVDGSLPENRDPQPQLEDGEFIETFTCPLNNLYAECRRFESEGYAVDARVGNLAEGIEVAKQFRLS